MVDIDYCSSSFLQFRTVYDQSKMFIEGRNVVHNLPDKRKLIYVKSADEIIYAISEQLKNLKGEKIAIALSGGIDSAILAGVANRVGIGKNTLTVTFRCRADSGTGIDETYLAHKYARLTGLPHEVIDITWADVLQSLPLLMVNKGQPVHSIEPLIYTASRLLASRGYTKFIFGNAADIRFGGLNLLMSRDWRVEDFRRRFATLLPEVYLRKPEVILWPIVDCVGPAGFVDVNRFLNEYDICESLGSYQNSCALAGIEFLDPYLYLFPADGVDIQRIRAGESKYLVRQVFKKLFPDLDVPKKIPMPRAVDLWLKDWRGPLRREFKPVDVSTLNGDQKWILFSLEYFLNLISPV